MTFYCLAICSIHSALSDYQRKPNELMVEKEATLAVPESLRILLPKMLSVQLSSKLPICLIVYLLLYDLIMFTIVFSLRYFYDNLGIPSSLMGFQ